MLIGKLYRAHCRAKPQGFTYLAVLIFIIISGISLTAVSDVWHIEAQREKERELLFIGEQYRYALDSYYQAGPDGLKQYPETIDELIEDNRFAEPHHHLRKPFLDPFLMTNNWGLIKVKNRIVGIYSNSPKKPLKESGFVGIQDGFNNAKSYEQWKFLSTYAAAYSHAQDNNNEN